MQKFFRLSLIIVTSLSASWGSSPDLHEESNGLFTYRVPSMNAFRALSPHKQTEILRDQAKFNNSAFEFEHISSESRYFSREGKVKFAPEDTYQNNCHIIIMETVENKRKTLESEEWMGRFRKSLMGIYDESTIFNERIIDMALKSELDFDVIRKNRLTLKANVLSYLKRELRPEQVWGQNRELKGNLKMNVADIERHYEDYQWILTCGHFAPSELAPRASDWVESAFSKKKLTGKFKDMFNRL